MNKALLTCTAAGCLAGAALLIAGPLDPPSGPVAPAYKTLTEVEPRTAISAANTPGDADSLFRITQPGSYYLTGNITGVSGKHGIQIDASNVTLDLNGFALRGVAGSLDGINIFELDGVAIAVRNGSVTSWGDCGLQVNDNGGHDSRVEVTSLRSSLNTSHGIDTRFSGVVSDCYVSDNGGDGISALGNSRVSNSTARFNAGDGISVNADSVVTSCVASSNAGTGFGLGPGCTLIGSTASGNAIGVTASASIIRDCVVSDSDSHGASVFSACTIADSTFYRNGGHGVDLNGGTNIKNCTASENDGHGFSIGTNSSIQGCTARDNGSSGINATNAAIILQNQCHNNGQGLFGGAGISVDGNDNRVEGNNCTSQDLGIDVNASGNFLLANTCSGNTTNWSVVANNKCLVVLGTNAGAINGDAGGTSPGSTNPWANFTY